MSDSSAPAGPAGPPSFGLSRLGQIAVTVSDVKRATAFYRDGLGLRFLFTAGPGLAFFDCGGVRLMLSRPEGDVTTTHAPVLYFTVDDLRQAYETLRARGVRFLDEPHLIATMPNHELWMAFFRDPDEHLLGLMSEVRRGQR